MAAFCALASLLTLGGGLAQAAFPGANGKIAYSTELGVDGGIWNVNSDGSGAAPLVGGAEGYRATYAPDGKRIAFLRDTGLYVMNADGSGETLLRADDSDGSEGSTVVEDYEDPETEDIYPLVRITVYEEAWDFLRSPAFAPDGASLAAIHARGHSLEEEICSIEDAESPCIEAGDPGYFRDFAGECIDCDEKIVSVSSTTGALLADLMVASEAERLAYSADGKLAYSRWTEGSSKPEVVVVPAPGAPPVVVYEADAGVSGLDFSPDGSRLAITSGDGLRLVGVGGGAQTAIDVPAVPGADEEFFSGAVFSPDGTRLAFSREAYEGGGASVDDGVFTIGIDGSGFSKLVAGAFGPSWQPSPAPIPAPAAIATTAKPPTVGAKKGPVKLDKKGRAVIGTITCGTSPCKLKVLSAKLKIEKASYAVKASAPKKLAAGKKGKIKVKVKGKALAALKAADRGKLTTKVRVTDAAGKKTVTLKSTLKG